MGPEILNVSDRLLAAVVNGIYQGILVTGLVALGFRVFRRINAATRHAVWLCTLVLLVLLVVAHGFFPSRPPALQPGKIARIAATPEQEIGLPNVAAVAATVTGMRPETGSSGPKWPGLPADQEQLVSQTPLTHTELPCEPVLKMGGAGDPPAPVGDSPTGTPASNVAKMRCSLTQTAAIVPSGESPDGTGGSPVLPESDFSDALQGRHLRLAL